MFFFTLTNQISLPIIFFIIHSNFCSIHAQSDPSDCIPIGQEVQNANNCCGFGTTTQCVNDNGLCRCCLPTGNQIGMKFKNKNQIPFNSCLLYFSLYFPPPMLLWSLLWRPLLAWLIY
jgi:hypothetical protein